MGIQQRQYNTLFIYGFCTVDPYRTVCYQICQVAVIKRYVCCIHSTHSALLYLHAAVQSQSYCITYSTYVVMYTCTRVHSTQTGDTVHVVRLAQGTQQQGCRQSTILISRYNSLPYEFSIYLTNINRRAIKPSCITIIIIFFLLKICSFEF